MVSAVIRNWDKKNWLSSKNYILRFNNFLTKINNLNSSSLILDVGCGRGKIIGTLRDKLKLKIKPIGIEGYNQSEWILIDYGDVLVHVMHPTAREFFSLEKLWDENLNPEVSSN